jgi:hemerythrin
MTASAPNEGKYQNLWNRSFELGIPLIDGQHKKLVQHLEALFQSVEKGQSLSEMRDCLLFLGQYVHEHFHTEEHYMQKHGYPGTKDHMEAHAHFKSDFGKVEKLIFDSPGSEQSLQLLESLVLNWYVQHVQGMDQKYAKFFRMQGLLNHIK